MNVKYGFTVTNDDKPEEVLHMVGFEGPPTEHDWNHILEELEYDPEFEYLKEYRWTMRCSNENEIQFINKVMKEYEEGNSKLTVSIHSKKESSWVPDTKH